MKIAHPIEIRKWNKFSNNTLLFPPFALDSVNSTLTANVLKLKWAHFLWVSIQIYYGESIYGRALLKHFRSFFTALSVSIQYKKKTNTKCNEMMANYVSHQTYIDDCTHTHEKKLCSFDYIFLVIFSLLLPTRSGPICVIVYQSVKKMHSVRDASTFYPCSSRVNLWE